MKNHHLSEIVQGSAIAFILKGIGAVLSFILNIYVARTLGVNDTGIFFLVITIIFVTASLGRFGLDNVVIRKISSFSSEKKWREVKSVFKGSMVISMILTAIFSLLLYIFSEWISITIFKKPELVSSLKWMTIRIIPIAVISIVAESLKGLKKIASSQLIFNIGLPLVSIITLVLIPSYHNLHGLVTIWNLSAIIVMIVSVIIWVRTTNKYISTNSSPDYKILITSGYPLFVVMALNMIITWSSTIFLGVFSENTDVGIFNVAVRTANLMNFLLVSVNAIAAPRFAELYHSRNFKLLKLTAQDTTKLMFWLSLPVFVLVMLFSSEIMGLFGSQFRSGGTILTILIISQFINVSTGSVGYLLIMSGQEKLLRNNIIFVAILNTILNIFLIPKYGIYGAVISSSGSLIIQNIISLFIVRVKLNFWTISLFEKFSKLGNHG
ncbi:MAG: flippase [Candidatus Marinimicrobia bacterium]|jgi:O-antigen/teichoic acid export membrane protein|nr:flippase [Candidatus Neomarinimicrobiota bacterium]MBT4851030.1 flippase [Candidatus Neomarinimicrobiota bacterium]MBT6713614.1 flippase [Candidatus Neomarinimicrobiota bacterium]MBT7021627.1 flippase [Candidatus Neomarinimicrobiota bacterium]MBT7884642.1 flippase [Candidatus Neomarinimicrobiota bacterium]